MPAMTVAGDPIVTTITADINSTDTTIALAVSSGWSTGAGGKPFVVRLESEDGLVHEKVLVASRSGLSLTVSARGYDGTTAQSFLAGSQVKQVLDAATVQALMNLLYDTEGDFLVQYLTADRHEDPTLHLVGGTIAAPTTISKVGVTEDVGNSENVAVEDHIHELDAAVAGPGILLTDGALEVDVDDVTIANAVAGLEVKDASISQAKHADDSVGAAQIIDDAVGNAALADDAVDSEQLVDGSVDPIHLNPSLPRGIVAYDDLLASSATVTTEAVVLDTGNVPIAADRRLYFSGQVRVSGSDNDLAVVRLTMDGNLVQNTRLRIAGGASGGVIGVVLNDLAPGDHRFRATIATSDTGVFSSGAPSSPAWIMVQDIGEAV